MIPIFVDCSGRRIVIFGGGDVAARKAAYFSGKADVTVVSRSFVPAFDGMKVMRVELDLETAGSRKLAEIFTGAFLVITAVSNPEINNRIGKYCKAMGILFNNADGECGDVHLPAVTGGEHYTIAISTGGESPAVSRYIREQVGECLPAGLDAMIALQDRLREALKETEPDQKKRSGILTAVLHDPAVWAALAAGGTGAWEDVSRRYLHG
jgi:precorrin-2 dehydrogenase / sirohydrochlorin ferrochelatase